MDTLEIALIVWFALAGAGLSYGLWSAYGWLRGRLATRTAAPGPQTDRADGTRAEPAVKPRAMDVPPLPDPTLAAQIAALREDMATLAAGQAALLEGQAEREARFLAEMRAVFEADEPSTRDGLTRIETLLEALARAFVAPKEAPAADPVPPVSEGEILPPEPAHGEARHNTGADNSLVTLLDQMRRTENAETASDAITPDAAKPTIMRG
ncbi:MAG: hypothetical protein AAGE76_03915 [Pseudomonadota bacterium]